jgi:hypothetical protein
MGSGASGKVVGAAIQASSEADLEAALVGLCQADAEKLKKALGQPYQAPRDYNSIESLWAGLSSGDVALLRGSWLVKLAREGGVLGRRQNCPPEAFISLEELQAIHESSSAKPQYSERKLAPILAVSHFWRAPSHPDGEGITVGIIGGALQDRMETYKKHGVVDVGVFFDYASLYQAPRSPIEDECFKRSLHSVNLWYAHALTTVYLVTDTPEGLTAYHDRGWTSFEYQITWLIKIAEKFNCWPQIVDLGSQCRRQAPAEPNAFLEGHVFGTKVFTNGADREKVAGLFRRTCEDVFGTVTELDYADLTWADAEMESLGTVFPLCNNVAKVFLDSNLMTCLPESIGQLQACKVLDLRNCSSLTCLPESIGQLQASAVKC